MFRIHILSVMYLIVEVMVDLLLDMERISLRQGLVYVVDELLHNHQPLPSRCYYCTITSPYLHSAIIAQSPAPTFTLLLLHNHQPLPSQCYYCTITSPYLHIAIIAQSPAPTFALLLLHNHQPLPSRCYYCTITSPYLRVAIIAQSPAPTFALPAPTRAIL